MVVIRLLALFLIVATFILVIVFGMTLSRKAKSEIDRSFISRFIVILVIVFAAGGITRTIQQVTGIDWLNGFVPIFGGLFLSLWGVPFFWRISSNHVRGFKGFLLFLPGLLFTLSGLGVIYFGISQVWKALL